MAASAAEVINTSAGGPPDVARLLAVVQRHACARRPRWGRQVTLGPRHGLASAKGVMEHSDALNAH